MPARGTPGPRKGTVTSPFRHPCALGRALSSRCADSADDYLCFSMAPHIELWTDESSELVRLDGDRLTIGTSTQNDLILEDEMVSRLHAVLEHYTSGWSIRDMGSRNGTFLNRERLMGEQALRPGDEIRLGDTRLVYRAEPAKETPSATRAVQAPPELTRRERDVILELCRPVLSGSLLTEPSTVREMAEALVVTESAVKKHLGRLFDKFGLSGDRERRRGRLAAEAIRRGAVGLGDVRTTPPR